MEENNKTVIRRKNKIPEAKLDNDQGHIISSATINILVQEQKATPDEIKNLMAYELNYNRERLSIMREHALSDPDSKEDRANKSFRRKQYYYLMALLPFLFYILITQNVTIAAATAMMAFFIIVSLAMNGRDRENDSNVLVAILDKLLRYNNDK